MRRDGKLDYLEFRAPNLAEVRAFYAKAFDWRFQDYGSTYMAFDEGLEGGFDDDAGEGPPTPVLYASDLEAMQARVEAAGGVIVKPIFDFPGGRRFHFRDPAGCELAVWSDA